MSSHLNTTWHLKHKMPKNPTLDQRIDWHLAHAKNCSCRPLGGKILEEISARGGSASGRKKRLNKIRL